MTGFNSQTIGQPRTFADLTADALSNDFDPGQYTPRVQAALNMAIADIARNVRLPALEGTYTVPVLAGQQTYALPTDFVRVYEVWDPTNSVPLDGIRIQEIDSAPPPVSQGRPLAWAIYQNLLWLWPVPNDPSLTVSMRYQRNAAPLLNPADPISGVIPEEYGDMLVAFARSRMFRFEDDADMAQFWRQEYEGDLQRLRGDVQSQQTRVRQVPGAWGRRRRPWFIRPNT